jgi:hypothetical protein
MNRQEKINLLKGIANGTRSLSELQIRYDLFICDTDKLVKMGVDGKHIVSRAEFDKLESQGLVKGFVTEINDNSIRLIQYN